MNTSTNTQLMKAAGLTKMYSLGSILGGSHILALEDVDIALDGARPTILSVVGESGCGKTTFARTMLKMVEPTRGTVFIEGKDVWKTSGGMSDMDFRRTVQPIFQNPFETFSARKPVDTYLHETATNLKIARNRQEATDMAAEALRSVGLDKDIVRGKYSYQFSGGELQRVSVARALIPKPKLIIADEPVSMIDASMKINIVNLFLQLKEDHKVSFVYITHDLATAYYVSDFVAIMYRGNVVEYGPAGKVMTDPLHPYTELLLQSVPRFGQKWQGQIKLSDIETREFNIRSCKFAPRCPYAEDICRQQRPPRLKRPEEREVLCFKPANYTL
jgi:peptide/nickel transport system ATP-binding protein